MAHRTLGTDSAALSKTAWLDNFFQFQPARNRVLRLPRRCCAGFNLALEAHEPSVVAHICLPEKKGAPYSQINNQMNLRYLFPASFCFVCSLSIHAASPDDGKEGYSIFTRVPQSEMRPLSSDEADKVIAPYTVDAGHVQVESDLVNYFEVQQNWNYPNEHIARSQDEFLWAPRFKVGLCERADFEVHFAYATQSIRDDYSGSYEATRKQHFDSFGAVNPKFKINLWGNEGGMTALAIAPFLSIPTDGFYDVTGGFDVPFAWRLPEGFTLKINPEF